MVHSIRFYISDFEGNYGNKAKDRITVGVTALILFGFLTGNIAKSDDTVSVSERRKLAQFPKINVENMKDGTL